MVMPAVNGHSVIKEPTEGEGLSIASEIVLSIASQGDGFPVWGTSPAARDRMLRQFWITEPVLASALLNMVSKYASFGFKLEGPGRIVKQYQRLIHGVEHGAGLPSLISKVAIDLLSQDNGAHIEVVRTEDSPSAPAVTLNHLDSARCVRTGRQEQPITYYDRLNKPHYLKWYQVVSLTEMPSPKEEMRGMQYCAVTRLLRAAQIMRDLQVYEHEKISGRYTRAIHIVSGVTRKTIEDSVATHQEGGDNRGATRYLQPLIIASLDPTANISKVTLELASLPDNFDKEVFMRWYINQLSLAFETDYQEFAPLPAGNLGTSQQSQILASKSKGKGPALFVNLIERMFNFHGILPQNVWFSFGDIELELEMQQAELRLKRAQERAARILSGEITPVIARQMALDEGDLREEYLELMGEKNETPELVITLGSVPA